MSWIVNLYAPNHRSKQLVSFRHLFLGPVTDKGKKEN